MIKTPPDLRALTFDLSNAVWSLATLGVLFESGLGKQMIAPRTIAELATACPQITASRIERVLAVALGHGIVVADGERFRVADGVAQVLESPLRGVLLAEIRTHLMQPVAFLDSAGTSTAWAHTNTTLLQAQGDASAVLPMMLKMQIAPQLGDLAARLARPGAKFLDVGTGVGSLAIAMCRAFPGIQVVGLDPYESALALARANVERAGAAVELRNIAVQDLRDEAAYACAWLPMFFVTSEAAAIARTYAALEPGGWLIAAAAGEGAGPKLVADVWGNAISAAQTSELLLAAGFVEVRTMPGPEWAPQMIVGRR
jgi:protein-L-isoaspartate O-methyltransferase